MALSPMGRGRHFEHEAPLGGADEAHGRLWWMFSRWSTRKKSRSDRCSFSDSVMRARARQSGAQDEARQVETFERGGAGQHCLAFI